MKTKNIHNEWVQVQILPHEYAILYREYFNDFLTIPRFAEYMEIHPKSALKIINKGRVMHNDIFGNQ